MSGGKRWHRKIHLHDYHTRRLALKIGRRIVEQCTDLSPRKLNITYFFPFNRKLISLVPDAVIFVRGQRYFIEYDRNTEPHFKLLRKDIGIF